MNHDRPSRPRGIEVRDRIIKVGIAAGILVSVALVVGVLALAFPGLLPPAELLPTLLFAAAVVAGGLAARRIGVRRQRD